MVKWKLLMRKVTLKGKEGSWDEEGKVGGD
jgi:hypothetical protein